MVSRVVKIQKIVRGFVGRRKAIRVYMQYLAGKAELIKGLHRLWKARRIVRTLRAEKMQRMVTKIQGLFRGRVARKIIAEWRRKRRETAARFLQRVARGYLGRRRARAVSHRSKVYFLRQSDTQKIVKGLQESGQSTQEIPFDISEMSDWEVYALVLTYLLLLQKPQVSLSLASQLTLRSPNFTFGVSILKVILLYLWISDGKSQLQRIDYLEESLGYSCLETKVSEMRLDEERRMRRKMEQEIGAEQDRHKMQMQEREIDYSFEDGDNDYENEGTRERAAANDSFYSLSQIPQLDDGDTSIISSLGSLNDGGLVFGEMTTAGGGCMVDSEPEGEADVLGLWEALQIVPRGTSVRELALYVDPVSRFKEESERPTVNSHESDVFEGSLPELPRGPAQLKKSGKGAGEVFNEIEYFYFHNAITRTRGNSHSLMLMALHIVVSQTNFGDDPYASRESVRRIDRVKRLLKRAKERAYLSQASSLKAQIEMYLNLFAKSHRVLATKSIKFNDCLVVDFVKSLAAGTNSRTKMVSLTCEVRVIQAGDWIVLEATLSHLKIDAMLSSILSPKWSSAASDSDGWAKQMHIRPFIVTKTELKSVGELAIASQAKALKLDPLEVRKRGVLNNVCEYALKEIRLVTCSSKWNPYTTKSKSTVPQGEGAISSLSDTTLRLTLPSLEYFRREANDVKKESFACAVLQKSYRGMRGRNLYRRLLFKAREERRQQEKTLMSVSVLEVCRSERSRLASIIQAAVKGMLWRLKIKRMKFAAVAIQCAARCKIAREKVKMLLQRRRNGPPVVDMMSQVLPLLPIGDVYLQMTRCGNNYKAVGKEFRYEKLKRNNVVGSSAGANNAASDAGHNDDDDDDSDDDDDDDDDGMKANSGNDNGINDGSTGGQGSVNSKRKIIIPGKCLCEGFFYEDQVRKLLARHNATILGDTAHDRAQKVHLHQHNRVAALLVANIAVSEGIQSLTQELGHKNKLLAIVIRKDDGPVGSHKGIQGSAKSGGAVSLKTRNNAAIFFASPTENGSLTSGGGLALGGVHEPRVSRILADQRDFIMRYNKLQLARQKLRDAKNAIAPKFTKSI